ncbi:MAG: PEP-CTERM sorting domain-containing protein [Proteobacteria bacterium]|nr:PEP-CTERM sorting domain-containing protein [Pseudomonadota bacterium]
MLNKPAYQKLLSVLFITAFLLIGVSSAHADTYFRSTIYDLNKYVYSGVPIPSGVDPTDTSDSEMCWAAASSNVLMYTGWGFDRNGNSSIEIYDDIYHDFLADYSNVAGNGSMAYDHYVSDFWGATLAANSDAWFNYFYTYTLDSNIVQTIDSYLHLDYGIYLSITNDVGTLGHAITALGYETDDSGNYTRLAVTDSDRATGIGETHLQWYDLDYRNNRWYLADYGTDVYIRRIDAFDQNPYASTVPEPATMLLLGFGLVGLAGFRRKIKNA